ncbi:MAG: hypothetical protein Q8921_15455 [Bacteroidota bacterium]|nr:hypothetical protein [Bacteroidota bacterium]
MPSQHPEGHTLAVLEAGDKVVGEVILQCYITTVINSLPQLACQIFAVIALLLD